MGRFGGGGAESFQQDKEGRGKGIAEEANSHNILNLYILLHPSALGAAP